MLLALDIATHVGWALGGPADRAPRFGTVTLPGGGGDDRAIVSLYDWLHPFCKLAGVKIVLIEAPFLAKKRDENNVSGPFYLVGVARLAACQAGASPILQNVKTVRSVFVGNGNLARDDAKRAVLMMCRNLGWKPSNDDEGDAGALWYWGMTRTYPKWSPR